MCGKGRVVDTVTHMDGSSLTYERVVSLYYTVMDHADVIGNGVITKPELHKAISLWYVHSGSAEIVSEAAAKRHLMQ